MPAELLSSPNRLSALLDTYLTDSLSILHGSLDMARAGHAEFYRVVALQLRLILNDTTRRHEEIVDISLAARLFPDLALARLEGEGTLPLVEWLDQSVPQAGEPVPEGNEAVTVRRLIRQVCDQDGGAHVDPHPRTGINSFDGRAGAILQLGELTAAAIEQARVLRAANPTRQVSKSGRSRPARTRAAAKVGTSAKIGTSAQKTDTAAGAHPRGTTRPTGTTRPAGSTGKKPASRTPRK